jgi:hypothetical protein
MEKALITVLMPVYNAEKFLKEAIESVLAQSFTAFEFLIIDDASTDASATIIQQYNDPRIRYLRNETNLGISRTLNRGIELATTEWIARMDADDISYSHRLEKQFRHCEAVPDCALVSCWARVITEDKQEVRTERYKSNYYYYNLTFECWIYHPTVMFRKSAVVDVGMYSVPYAEDYELFWQLLRKYKICNLPEVLLDYRITSSSLHQVTRKKEYDEAMAKQIARSIAFYAGELALSHAEFECLRHNFGPMLKENSVTSIARCLQKLDKITVGIIEKGNVNRNEPDIKEAAFHKRAFIITYFIKNLSWPKALALVTRTNSWNVLYRLWRA